MSDAEFDVGHRRTRARMHIETTGSARIRHNETGAIHQVEANELDWEVQSTQERDMGPETEWSAALDHENLGELVWTFSEYPQGFANEPNLVANGHEVLSNFSVNIDEMEDENAEDFDAESAAEEMKDWFYTNYEDPVERLPYISAEGGYKWVFGSSETALGALEEAYSDEYPFKFIEKVAQSITDETGIFDWSPTPGQDFYDNGDETESDLDGAEELSRRLPLSEELVSNPELGTFSVRPIEVAKPDLLGAALSQVADAVDDILANPTNGLNENALEIRRLRRTLLRYSNDPQRVEMDFTSTHGSIVSKIASEELPPSDENNALVTSLREGAQGIRATHPVVAENRKILQEQAVKELTDQDLAQIVDADSVLKAITEGELQDQMREDVLFLTEELQAGPPPLPGVTKADAIIQGRDEVVRVLGRSARMMLILRKTPGLADRLYNSTGFKVASILGTLGTLVSLGLLLF
ncbi:hypothetical protein [Falsihalocynthiibacter arcticus]|uniref:Uncharacterized protein n=1 Tax=Falsihalocynthiibacter arcticus TaxID=1579316 RepID=A0A126UVZ3_9RHOB|nr:hypothetical protein [Falsihalocynthiibacter arcticus]AML50194.1 hypothetical protein RC74_01955 [Falsihalocynthiibacter arcticus]